MISTIIIIIFFDAFLPLDRVVANMFLFWQCAWNFAQFGREIWRFHRETKRKNCTQLGCTFLSYFLLHWHLRKSAGRGSLFFCFDLTVPAADVALQAPCMRHGRRAHEHVEAWCRCLQHWSGTDKSHRDNHNYKMTFGRSFWTDVLDGFIGRIFGWIFGQIFGWIFGRIPLNFSGFLGHFQNPHPNFTSVWWQVGGSMSPPFEPVPCPDHARVTSCTPPSLNLQFLWLFLSIFVSFSSSSGVRLSTAVPERW